MCCNQKLKDIPIGPSDKTQQTPAQRVVKKALWFVSISRNAVTVLLCAILAYYLSLAGPSPILLSRPVQPGLPSFQLPPFTATHGNETFTFGTMVHELGSAIILVPLVAVLANVAIAKAFGELTFLRYFAAHVVLCCP